MWRHFSPVNRGILLKVVFRLKRELGARFGRFGLGCSHKNTKSELKECHLNISSVKCNTVQASHLLAATLLVGSNSRWGREDVLYVVLHAPWCCWHPSDVSVYGSMFVNRQSEDGLSCWNPPPTVQAPVDHFNLPPHVSKGTAFPETWHTVQGGVTSSDRIDNLPF